jgi:DNA-binding transcriptional MerR regulator
MTEETADSPLTDYVNIYQVTTAAGVDRAALREWIQAGLLPKPQWTGGRGVLGKWPRVTLKIAAFVRGQRELGFGLQDIRARIVAAFGEKVLEVLAEPRTTRAQTNQAKKKLSAKKRARQ